jgi:hypothetical protein
MYIGCCLPAIAFGGLWYLVLEDDRGRSELTILKTRLVVKLLVLQIIALTVVWNNFEGLRGECRA